VVWLEVAVVMFAPVLLMRAIVGLPAILDAVENGWHWLRHAEPEVTPAAAPLQQLAADLHRLAVDIDRVEASDAPAKVARLRAVSLAYDDVLLIACRTLEVPAPERTPLRSVERLQTEAALAQQGLVW
jgi:hypothetical protein